MKTPKAAGIMQHIGFSDYVIPIESATPERLKDMFDALVENRQAISSQINKAVSRIHCELEKWKQEVAQLCCAYC